MQSIVLDTNIIVSALWSKTGNAAAILNMVADKEVIINISQGVLDEYEEVLSRDKFKHKFSIEKVSKTLALIQSLSNYFVPQTSTTPAFIDETDRKFYDLAKAANAYLITGNAKHYPVEEKIVSPAEFLEKKI